MQVKNETSKNEGKKRSIADIILVYGLAVTWVAFQICVIFFMWPAYLIREQELLQTILGIVLGAYVLVFFYVVLLKVEGIADKRKIRYISITALITTTITIIIGPFALQGVYHATKENIVITEKTDIVSTKIIDFTETEYLIDINELKQKVESIGQNDVIEVQFEQNVQPYVKVVQYCIVSTTDNQNPWGRKTTETTKKWKEYEFHLPALEVSN